MSGRLTSTYYSSRPYGYHAALDVAASSWTSIGASRGGTCTYSGYNGGYGNLVILSHGAGYTTYYAHQVQRVASYGRSFSTGQTIGYVGSTGNSTGPHVHWEVRRYGSKLYMPGSGGNWVTKGNSLPYDYSGIGSAAPAPDVTNTSDKAVKVTASVLNVRTGPGTGYSVKGQARSGQQYVSVAKSGSWHKIWFDGSAGWIHGAYVSGVSGVSGLKVATSVLNVRTGPGTGYRDAGNVKSGQIYRYSSKTGDWYKIWWKGGMYYIHGDYVRRVSL